MTVSDGAITAVTNVTGVSKNEMFSKSRVWRIHEARLLLIMLLFNTGYSDGSTAAIIGRSRVTVCKLRKTAGNYLIVSNVFKQKLKKISELYESGKHAAR